jgi:hypothetical protein
VTTFADRKGGFPHSEMSGSKGARASPDLIAACHVLHRLSTPRHPSEALMRLIVLSKTHAWGQKCPDEGTKPGQAPTHALCISDNDVFSDPSSNSRGSRMNPSIHDVRFAAASVLQEEGGGAETRLLSAIAAEVVEPDGIEPTTSCLQSTRSTN